METIVLLVLFLTAAHGFSTIDFLNEFGLTVNRAAQSCETNNKVGFICSADCKKILLCMKNGEEWTENLFKDCKANEGEEKEVFCNLNTLECDNASGHCKTADKAKISCTGSGLYPDPYDCQRFHACSNNQSDSVAMDCSSNTHFDPETKQCVLGIDSSTCNNAKTDCSTNSVGTVKPWPGNSAYFYICMGDSKDPLIYSCDVGYVYVHPTGCVKGSVTTTVAPPSVTCDVHNGNVRDPANCYKYYRCRLNQDPVNVSCPRNHYFNRKWRECQRGDCPYS